MLSETKQSPKLLRSVKPRSLDCSTLLIHSKIKQQMSNLAVVGKGEAVESADCHADHVHVPQFSDFLGPPHVRVGPVTQSVKIPFSPRPQAAGGGKRHRELRAAVCECLK